MGKIVRANSKRSQTSGGDISDDEIKRRNFEAHQSFLAARSASKRGFNQKDTKIRTGKDGTKISGSKGSDKRNSAATRSSARKLGVNAHEDKPLNKPFKAGRSSRSTYTSTEGADPRGYLARGNGTGKRSKGKGKGKDEIAGKGKDLKSKLASIDLVSNNLQGLLNVVKQEQIKEKEIIKASTHKELFKSLDRSVDQLKDIFNQ